MVCNNALNISLQDLSQLLIILINCLDKIVIILIIFIIIIIN